MRRLVGVTFEATVTSVVDGDTVHAALPGGADLTVRLEGIDAPERGEPFSAEARNYTRVRLFSKRASVRGTDVDRYGRLVARITVGSDDLSLGLVSAGLACHFTRYSQEPALAAAQRAAQASGLGFWSAGASKPACARGTVAGAAVSGANGPFHGNSSSHVYHAATCPNYRCRNCTAVFATRDAAAAAGYRPAGDCLR